MVTLTVRYSRAIRRGERIYVSGTTATDAQGLHVGGGDAFAQAVFILDKIEAAIRALGGRIEDVVRTRMYVIFCRWLRLNRFDGCLLGVSGWYVIRFFSNVGMLVLALTRGTPLVICTSCDTVPFLSPFFYTTI